MLQETYYSAGKNNFKGNKFSSEEWSAPYMVDPEEIKSAVSSFHLEGRTIMRLNFIGMDYSHSRDFVEDAAHPLKKDIENSENML